MYLITGVVIGVFCYESYSTGYGKGIKNPFSNYFFWVALFMSIAFLHSVVIIPISITIPHSDLLFWTDLAGRALFYIAAVFSVQIPLYQLFPKSKKTIIFPYAFGVIGALLLVYQLCYRNIPIISSSGIVNWNADIVLAAGMAILLIIPWGAISFIFIRQFVKSKFSLPKSFLLGTGFFLICIGALFQDLSSTVITYIFFGTLLVIGFLFALAGMFYESDRI
jgi:hypothetical protein